MMVYQSCSVQMIRLFMDDSIEEAKNMKLSLTTFEQLSGLKINYHKSELYCFDDAKTGTGQLCGYFRMSSG